MFISIVGISMRAQAEMNPRAWSAKEGSYVGFGQTRENATGRGSS